MGLGSQFLSLTTPLHPHISVLVAKSPFSDSVNDDDGSQRVHLVVLEVDMSFSSSDFDIC